MVIDPHSLTRHDDPPVRALIALTIAVTERPWALTGDDLARARAGGLDDAAVLHAILQSSLFGHLNRIADAVGVEADYPDRFGSPHVEPATPPYLPASDPPPAGSGPIALELRAGATDLRDAWRAYALDRETPTLDRRRRTVIAAAVARVLGDLATPPVDPTDDLDRALIDLAEIVALAPWRLGTAAYARVRALGPSDDAAVFDAVATASGCTVFSRIAVALAGFAR